MIKRLFDQYGIGGLRQIIDQVQEDENTDLKETIRPDGIGISGNTWPIKDKFKPLGFRWDPKAKQWVAKGTPEEASC